MEAFVEDLIFPVGERNSMLVVEYFYLLDLVVTVEEVEGLMLEEQVVWVGYA